MGILNTNAQATLMYELIQHFGFGMLRTIIRYCNNRISKLNKELDDRPVYKENPVVQRNRIAGDEML